MHLRNLEKEPEKVNPGTEKFRILMTGALPVDLKQVKGGVEAVILNLLEGFRQIPEVDVRHVTFSKETKQQVLVQLAPNVSIVFLPFMNQIEFIDYVKNEAVLNSLIREYNPDIIHIQEITPHLLRFLRLPKDNIVVTQHGVMREEYRYAEDLPMKFKCMFKAYVERYVFPRFKNVVFISEYNRSLYPGKPAKSVRVFNPVNPIFLHTTPAKDDLSQNLLYVGVLSRRKNIRLVIEALHVLKERGRSFHLHVAGGFKKSQYENEIRSLVTSLGLEADITFHGWLQQEQIRALYDTCPMFILPSLQETLPVSIAEAMAMGKIVIASDVGAIREMFTDGVSGFLFRRNDKTNLVNVLERVYTRTSDNTIGASAQREAWQKFDPVGVAQQHLSFYRQVASTLTAKKKTA
jgi:glycosyltransferase involved in cell wall biosynthesis